MRNALSFFQMCNCNKVVSCLCCQVPLEKWIELFCNMYCNKGCFWLALSRNSLEKGIELLWNVHCNKVCFVLMLSRLFKELGYY